MGNLQIILNIMILVGLIILIVLFLKNTWQKNLSKVQEENQQTEHIKQLRDSINNQINSMSSSFNTLSKDVTRDMTQALTKVDKIKVLNK